MSLSRGVLGAAAFALVVGAMIPLGGEGGPGAASGGRFAHAHGRGPARARPALNDARGRTSCRGSTRPGRQRSGGVTPGYRRMRARWHARAPRDVLRAWLEAAVRPLVLRPVHGHETYTLLPEPSTGRFGEAELAVAREAFRYHLDDATADVHPRLLELVYRAVEHFEVPYVHLISGYRTTRATSRHNQGRAMDFVLPGVSDRGLANFLHRQGFVGVGVYPLSGFVHLDVRERSFFWVDRSAPGRRSRVRGVAHSLCIRYDRLARARGEEPVPDFVARGEEGDAAEGEGSATAEGRAGAIPTTEEARAAATTTDVDEAPAVPAASPASVSPAASEGEPSS